MLRNIRGQVFHCHINQCAHTSYVLPVCTTSVARFVHGDLPLELDPLLMRGILYFQVTCVRPSGYLTTDLLTFNVTRYTFHVLYMIKSFHCKDTQALFEGKCPRQFRAIATVAERKLQMLNDAYAINDLRVPPGNRLKALHGNRKGQWSIRINDQWRLCFRFEDGNTFDVEIVDYH